jgi:hypothetical protein
MGLPEDAALFLNLGEAEQRRIRIMAHPLGVMVDYILDFGQPVPHLQDFIHLLLIFGQDHPGVGMVDDVLDFGGDGILVKGDRHTPERLSGHQRPVQLRAIVTDDGQLIAALKTERGEPERKVLDLLQVLRPTVGLPDPVGFLSDGGLVVAIPLCVRYQQFRESVADYGHAQPPRLPSASSPR